MKKSDIGEWDEPAPKVKMPTKRREPQDGDEEHIPGKRKKFKKRSNRVQNPKERLWEDSTHERPKGKKPQQTGGDK